MTRRFSVVLVSVIALLVLATPRSAQAQAQIEFQNINPNDGVYDGFYAGIYTGTVNGVQTNFVCDDFLTEINYNTGWLANVNNSSGVSYNGGGAGPGTGVRYAPTNGEYSYDKYVLSNPWLNYSYCSNPQNNTPCYSGLTGTLSLQQEYNMIAYLMNLIFTDTNNHDGNWANMAGAIWSIADGGWNTSDYTSTKNTGGTETAASYVQQALTNGLSYSSNFNIYTPQGWCNSNNQCTDSSNNGQEFWSEPEPAALVLLGWGTLAFALGSLMRKKLLA